MHKIIQVNQFQIFLDHRDDKDILIDNLIEIDNIKGAANFDELL